ncbi:hypothetical protein Sjap_012052 [Stephania japonica]|uniref:RING-type E3 ubiquitin transferase n=1 Tax=Stephania japonica TaxID=461633 RepID=A0AAP0JEK3_9MAGN
MEEEVKSSSSGGSREIDEGPVIELSGKIMLAAVILLFCVILLVLVLHLYARWFYFWRRQRTQQQQHEQEEQLDDVNDGDGGGGGGGGVDASVIGSLPILIFKREVEEQLMMKDDEVDGLECAVCLCDVSEGERVRLLPKCNHGFHVECIDMWFQTHHTCPLCRSSVAPAPAPAPAPDDDDSTPSTESPIFPTNVLFWGNQIQIHVTTRGTTTGLPPTPAAAAAAAAASPIIAPNSSTPDDEEGTSSLVIDIPITLLSQNSDEEEEDEEKEHNSPPSTTLRSLRRLLTRDKRVLHFACNTPTTTTFDVEFGGQTSKSSSDL